MEHQQTKQEVSMKGNISPEPNHYTSWITEVRAELDSLKAKANKPKEKSKKSEFDSARVEKLEKAVKKLESQMADVVEGLELIKTHGF